MADLKARGVGLVVFSMSGAPLSTRNPTATLMLTILAGVATWEREIMLERRHEGIAKAKAKAEGIGPAVIARLLGVARSSAYRLLAEGGGTPHDPAGRVTR